MTLNNVLTYCKTANRSQREAIYAALKISQQREATEALTNLNPGDFAYFTHRSCRVYCRVNRLNRTSASVSTTKPTLFHTAGTRWTVQASLLTPCSKSEATARGGSR